MCLIFRCCAPAQWAVGRRRFRLCPGNNQPGALLIAVCVAFGCCGPLACSFGQSRGEFEIQVADADTGAPVAVTMYLRDQRGRPVKASRLPFWEDHFAFHGTVLLQLRPGQYTFEIDRGPEYQLCSGNFEIKRSATDNTKVTVQRFVDMKKEGWWSGDLHVHRPPADVPLLMTASDLYVAPVITWWNERRAWRDEEIPDPVLVPFDGNRFHHRLAGEDERGGGALLYFNLSRPLPLPESSQREYPPMAKYAAMAREAGAHIDIEKPFWWDMPTWVALGLADSIGLANNHQLRDGMLDNEAWGKPRDTTRYPSPLGNGHWSQDIYHRLLNCGIRLPPSAGSASGVLKNPVGYNRVYVHCGERMTYQDWWEGLRAGRVVVTNGPMLQPEVNGQMPGHVFRGNAGETVELQPKLNLAIRDKVDYLEVIQNGALVHEVRLDEYKNKRGVLPRVAFRESGWMLIRAVTTNSQTFRFASTGPYYVEIGGRPRISRRAAQFFLDWVDERIAHLQLDHPAQKEEVLKYHQTAREFWQHKVDEANAE